MSRATAHTHFTSPTTQAAAWLATLRAAVRSVLGSACWAVGLGLAAVAVAQTPPTAPLTPAPTAAPVSPSQPATPLSSGMDAQLFFQLLAGEMHLRQSDAGSAYSLVFDAANRTRRPELYRRAIEIALLGRAGNAALNAARHWRDAHPDSSDPYRYELQILLALNRPAEVANTLRQLVRLSPPEQRADVITAIPQTLARISDRQASLQAVRQALAPALQDTATASAAHAAIGHMQLAAGHLAAAYQSAHASLHHQPGATAALALAIELAQAGHPPAFALLRNHLAQPAPADQEPAVRQQIHLAYVQALMQQQQYTDAARALPPLLHAQPPLAGAWLLQGMLQAQWRHPSLAETAFQRYLELARELPPEEARSGTTQAYLQLARLAEQRHDWAGASAWLDRIENSHEVLSAQMRRAVLLARQGQLDAARALLQQHPTRNDAELQRRWVAEAHMLRETGHYEPSLAVYTLALERFPDDPDLRYETALAAAKMGQYDTMERLLRELIAQHPDYYHAFNALGYSLADRNVRLDEAKTLIEQARAAAPMDPYIIDSLGWVHFRLGHHTQALHYLRDAFGRMPDAEIAAHLGEVLWVLQQRDEALNIWREGLRLQPDNATLRQTLQRLQAQP